MPAKLVCDALHMAIQQRQPGPGLIVHSDQGMSNKEIQRCLKRYIVRELYPLVIADLTAAAQIP